MKKEIIKENIEIINDDCINVLKELKDNSIDCIITDPPYNVSVNHDGGKLYHNKGITKSNEDLVRDKINTGYDIETIGKELLRVCKEPNIYIWCNKQQIPQYFDFYVNKNGLKFDILTWIKCLSGSQEIFIKNYLGVVHKENFKDLYRNFNKNSQYVYTKDGWIKIEKIEKIEKKEWIEITLKNGNTIECSLEHPFYIKNKLVIANELEIGDILDNENINIEKQERKYISNEVMWLAGFYLANGSKQKHQIISFSQNKEKQWQTDKIIDVVKQYGGKYYIFDDKHYENIRVVNVSSDIIQSIIDTFIVGTGAYKKHLSKDVWTLPNEKIENLLNGYLDGDGCFDKQNNRYRLGFTRKNYNLAKDLITLCSVLDYKISLTKGYTTFKNKKYAIWRGEIRKEFSNNNSHEIRDIVRKKGNKTFYDIQLEKKSSHTYLLFDGVVTHNCNALPTYKCKYLDDKEYCLYFKGKGVLNPTTYEDAKTYWLDYINAKDKKLWGHPTIKPLQMIEKLVKNSSKENDLILDPYMGSGTTGVACKDLNRKFIGVEINEKYYEIAKKRISE